MNALSPTIIRRASALVIAVSSAAAGITLAAVLGLGLGLPDPDEFDIDEIRLGEAVTLLDRHGNHFAAVGGETRLTVPLDEMPSLLKDAWVLIEDRRFTQHHGVDLRGVARAGWVNLTAGGVREGASSIAMQVVRLVWADDVAEMGRWERKLFEARMAPRLIEKRSHEGVLELYLNGLYLGEGVYGVGAAARHYYGKQVDELTVGEIATLVGVGKTPGRYNPRLHPERARERRDIVLRELARAGLISQDEFETARSESIETLDASPVGYRRTYVSEAVRRELRSVAPELVGIPGLRVHTTIDPEAQLLADSTLTRHLRAVEAGELGRRQSLDQPVQGALIAMDSKTGEIRAVSGGRDFTESPLNRAIQTTRQVGSLAKPLLLAAALESGLSMSRPISTAPFELATDAGMWSPADHVEAQFLLPDEVVIRSSNRGAVRLGQALGPANFVAALDAFGVGEHAKPYPSSFLGSFEASLADMTAAYAAFENGGYRVTPHFIRSIQDARGTVLWQRAEPRTTRVVTETTAFQVMEALRGVVDRGTGWAVRSSLGYGRLAAGKTGTSNEGRDAWFVGLMPGLALGTWIGHDQPAPVTAGGSGSSLAAPLWAAFAGDTPALDPDPDEPNGWVAPEGMFALLTDGRGNLYEKGCHAYAAETIRPVWVSSEALLGGLTTCRRVPQVDRIRARWTTLELKPIRMSPLRGQLGRPNGQGAPTPPSIGGG